MKKPILCLDFDGVIHSYSSGWKGKTIIPDPVVPGFFEWAVEAAKVFELHIFSSRSEDGDGTHALAMYMIQQYGVWRKGAGAGERYGSFGSFEFPIKKPAAMITIDDRALTFNGDWSDPKWSPAALLNFKPWNKP